MRWISKCRPFASAEQTEVQQHAYLVTYDISCPRRWRKVFKAMHGFGSHAQLSVFLCDLTPLRYERMIERLATDIHHTEDQVLVFRLAPSGRATAERVEAIGRPFRYDAPAPTVV